MKKKHKRNLYLTLISVFLAGVLTAVILLVLNENPDRIPYLWLSGGIFFIISIIFFVLYWRSCRSNIEKNPVRSDSTSETHVEDLENDVNNNKRDFGLLIVILINIFTVTILFFTYYFILQTDCIPCPDETETPIQDAPSTGGANDNDTSEVNNEIEDEPSITTTTIRPPDTFSPKPEVPKMVYLLVGSAYSDTSGVDWYIQPIPNISTIKMLAQTHPRIKLNKEYLFYDSLPQSVIESARFQINNNSNYRNKNARIVEVKRGVYRNGPYNFYAKLKFE